MGFAHPCAHCQTFWVDAGLGFCRTCRLFCCQEAPVPVESAAEAIAEIYRGFVPKCTPRERNVSQGVCDVSRARAFVADRPSVSGQFAQTRDGVVESYALSRSNVEEFGICFFMWCSDCVRIRKHYSFHV